MVEHIHDLLVQDEGLRFKPYKDTVGKITIGVGRNLTDKGLSLAEIEYLLDNDITDCKKELDKALPWWRKLSEARQAVFISMVFNMGLYGWLGFHTTLALIEAGDYTGAAEHMLQSKWADQVGDRAIRLSRMMATGQWHD